MLPGRRVSVLLRGHAFRDPQLWGDHSKQEARADAARRGEVLLGSFYAGAAPSDPFEFAGVSSARFQIRGFGWACTRSLRRGAFRPD